MSFPRLGNPVPNRLGTGFPAVSMLLADCFLFLFLYSAGRLNAYGVFGEEASNANDAVSISSMPAAAVTGTERHDVTVLMTLV